MPPVRLRRVPPSPLFRVAALAAVVVLAVLAARALLGGDGDGGPRPSALVPVQEGERAAPDPFAWDPDREGEFVRRATAGHSHVLYAKSPGGVAATAARVARYRELVEDVAEDADVDADTLEALVFLESAGRPDARAGDDPEAATGLTQILAETAQNLLGMRVDVRRSGRLTRRIARAERRGQVARAARLRAERRRVDERFDPAKALRATGRYLSMAEERFGREDLAVASYHMGMGNLENVRAAFGAQGDTSYAELFFDSSPLRHPRAWSRLAELGDDSSTYLFRVLAGREIMRLAREDPDRLADRAARMTAKNSAEEVLHPLERTQRFGDREDLEDAYDDGTLAPLPAELRTAGWRVDRRMGELARRLKRSRTLYRGLRPEALALLVYLGRGTQAIGGPGTLTLTSTVRDGDYQRVLAARNPEATHGDSLHTTGWAFDVLRRYRSRGQALAFQFMLDRLQSLNLIAWVREPMAIHVTVAPGARRLLPLLREAEG